MLTLDVPDPADDFDRYAFTGLDDLFTASYQSADTACMDLALSVDCNNLILR